MGFGSYGGAMKILHSIRIGTISGLGRSIYMKQIKGVLREDNPLHLTASERKKLTAEIESLSGKRISPKQPRPSPSVSATSHCGKKKRGNDGNMYLSKPNKNGVCRWVKV
jgi:hypothetical protein